MSKNHNAIVLEAAVRSADLTMFILRQFQASNIVQHKSKAILLPLVDAVLKRVRFIFEYLFDVAIDAVGVDLESGGELGHIDRYETFIAAMRVRFSEFVQGACRNCKSRLLDDFSGLTNILDWDLFSGLQAATRFSFNFNFNSNLLI